MSKADKLINKGESIMSVSEKQFSSNVFLIEKLLMKEINKLFDVVDINAGKLRTNQKTQEFLLSLDQRIMNALEKSGYNESVFSFMKNFDRIKENNIDIQSAINGQNIAFSSLNDITKLETQNTIDKLMRTGISRDFIVPIRESIYRNVMLGADVNDAKKSIESYILTKDGQDSKLLRYTTQVARDSINQFDGAIQGAIKNELGYKDYLYAGSLIEDSRGQCIFWVGKSFLKGEELEGEIKTAIAGNTLGGHKCSGMILDTTVDTFSVYRGGYNCRHRAISTRIK